MGENWYYVEGSERVGPISWDEMTNLITQQKIDEESFLWKKGLENWTKAQEIDEVKAAISAKQDEEAAGPPSIDDSENLNIPSAPSMAPEDLDSIDPQKRVFLIKVGIDRGGEEVEYGPFSLEILQKLFEEGRINERTLIYTKGMETWEFLGDSVLYRKISSSGPPVIEDRQRRKNVRRPFVARLFFHDGQDIFEGVCRDISIGGLQVLAENIPATPGTIVNMNVHPENSDYSFVAQGEVVRVLEGNQGVSMRFITPSEDAKEAIERYINQYRNH